MKNPKIRQVKFLLLFLLLILLACSYGCAGSRASISPVQPVEKDVVLTGYENLEIKTGISDDVEMSQPQADRIVDHIISILKEKNPACFNKISKECSGTGALLLDIDFTRYEEGSSFARLMMAGLGQMHIDATVKVMDQDTGQMFGEYEVDKTFAWGGIYGAGKRIEDIEPAFAEAVADIVLQTD